MFLQTFRAQKKISEVLEFAKYHSVSYLFLFEVCLLIDFWKVVVAFYFLATE